MQVFNSKSITAREGRVEEVVFWVLLALHLVPIWSFRYFLTADGPAHLYNAWLLKNMLADPNSVFHHYFAFNFNPEPNYLSHLLLGGLLTVLPPWLAEKALLTLYVVGLPLAARYMLRAWRPSAGFLTVLVFPLVYSAVFLFGFYNFCLSLLVMLLVLGYWRRHLAGRFRWPAVLALAGLVTLLYVAHPLGYLTAALALGLLLLAQRLSDWRLSAEGAAPLWTVRQWWLSVLAVALAYLPTLPLLLWYFLRQGTSTRTPAGSFLGGLLEWLRMEPIRFMSSPEVVFRVLLMGLWLATVVYALWWQLRRRVVVPALGWAAAVLVLVLAYAMLPDAIAGGSILRPRIGLLSYLLLLGGLATVHYSRRLRLAVVGVGGLVAVLLLGARLQTYRALQREFADYYSVASHLPAGATIAPLTFDHLHYLPNGENDRNRIDVLERVASYISIERNLLNYENYEAEQGYFPLVWQQGRAVIGQTDYTPTTFDLRGVPRQRIPNYVLVWAADGSEPTTSARLARQQLERHYHQVYVSPSRRLQLYAERLTGRALE